MRTIRKIEQSIPNLRQRKKVAAYARVSVESERMHHSLSAQVSYYSSLIQKNPEWEYAGVYADYGISGTGIKKRQEFQRMLEDAEQGKIDLILTKSIQRFARNTVDLLCTVRHLKDLGIEVWFEKEHIHTMSGEGELMLTILASFAQEESRSISTNVKWGTRKRFAQGIPNGRFRIYGYRWQGDQLVPEPKEASVVKLIYDNFLKGLSAETTERQLEEMGIKSFNGKHFGNSAVRRILENITYTGNLLFQKAYSADPITGKTKINHGELPQYFVENTHEAIIPMETYKKVQEERERRRELGALANWSIDTCCFTSKIRCGICGKSFVHIRSNRKNKDCWTCISHKERGRTCRSKGAIPQKVLVKECTEVLGLFEFDENVFLNQVDPCCGSGSFLLAIIRKIRIEDHGDAKTTLHRILNNVWGFDLNPLAVQTARVNYLIAIADLIKKVPGTDIEIPILLADAIYSLAPDPMMGSKFVYYEIGSHIANLQIVLPAELASDRRLLDNVFALMEKCVENNMSPNLICDALVEQGILNRDEIGSWKEALETTYSHVLSLHKRKWNGIWFRIVRNYFWSSSAGHFDVIVGNPPWVRWSKLPKLYQQRVMPTCEKYDIFAKTKYFGGNELDISGLITYTVADKWLSEGGKLIFLITQTHFQSASSSGFRKFKLDSKSYLKPLLVEDMKELKPFADAANKTALFVGIKSEDSPSYPIKYIIWKKKDGFSARIPENLSSDEVSMRTIHVDYEANPVGDLSTPWAILPKGDFKLLKKLMGTCSWIEGKKGITTDLNGVYFVKILQYSEDSRLVQIETRPEAGKTDIGPKQKFWVEPDLLYPVIKGAGQISCCGYTQLEDLAVIVPNNGILREDYLVSWEQMNKQYPHLLEYFTNFKALLANRSTYRTRMPNAPFYAVYNVGQYTFEPWKVIWAEQPGKDKFPVSVIHTQRFLGREDKVVIPDHKVYFASFPDSEHAYYLCGLLLNSTVVTYLNSFQIKVQVGDIFKHLKLPEMNSTNEMHQELISLTRMAHKEEDIFRKETLLNKISSLAGKIIF